MPHSYTAQVLAKSCKLIPVMVAGTLLYNKRYSAAEYLTAVLVAGGIVLFAVVKNSDAVLQKLAAPHAPVGYLLVTLNLALDAYTNSTQDRVRICCLWAELRSMADDQGCPVKTVERALSQHHAAGVHDVHERLGLHLLRAVDVRHHRCVRAAGTGCITRALTLEVQTRGTLQSPS